MKKMVAVIGDLIIDKFLYFESTRLSPEGPGPIVRKIDERTSAGGAGNVAISLSNLGFKVDLLYQQPTLDDFLHLKKIDKVFNSNKITLLPLKSKLKNPTPIKTRYYVENRHFMREDTEDSDLANKSFIINKLIDINFEKYDAIVVSDYQKGFFSSELLQSLIKKCSQNSIPIFIDTKNKDINSIKNAFCLKINENEFNILFSKYKFSKENKEDLILNNINLARVENNLINLVVTRGDYGSVCSNENQTISCPAKKVEVNDITGAGDAFLSGLIYSFLKKKEVNKIENCFINPNDLDFANSASSSVILFKGTVPISRSFLDNLDSKKTNQIIGFTNGCFDILHEGHILLLKEAKNNCNYLIVGLNSDSSVKNLKGNERPINNQERRKTILESIKFVDEVIIFNELTPLNLIKRITPNILIKGADYKEDEIVGADYVKENGGKVVRIDLVSNVSTSKIISEIKD